MATPQVLFDYFSGPVMTELAVAEAVKRGVPDVLPPALAVRSPNSPVGTQVIYDKVTGNRSTPPLVNQMAGSVTVETEGIEKVQVTALGSKMDFVVGQELLYYLQSPEAFVKRRAVMELKNKQSNFAARFGNLAVTLRNMLFANGKVWADGDGNILFSATGAKRTYDATIPVGNTLTKNGASSSYNIGDWSSTSTAIPGFLRALRIANTQANGYQLKTILYGSAVPDYIFANTAVQEYLKRNPLMNQQVLDTNEIPQGLMGWNWKAVGEAFYDDYAGTTRSIYPTNFLGIMPDPSPNWYEYFECGTLIPKGLLGVGASMDALNSSNIDVAYGLFSYALVNTNPLALQTIMGLYCLPVIKVPGTTTKAGVYYFGTCS